MHLKEAVSPLSFLGGDTLMSVCMRNLRICASWSLSTLLSGLYIYITVLTEPVKHTLFLKGQLIF